MANDLVKTFDKFRGDIIRHAHPEVTTLSSNVADLSGIWSYLDTAEMVFSPTTGYTEQDTTIRGHLSGIADALATKDSEVNVVSGLALDNLNNGIETPVGLAWANDNRTAILSASVGDVIEFNVDDVRFSVSSPQTIQIDDTDGFNFVYFDNAGTLTKSNSPWDIMTTAPVMLVYWNSTLSGGIGVPIRETHTAIMDQATHRQQHLSQGSKYASGGEIGGYTLATASDAAITFYISGAAMMDEDIYSTLAGINDGGPYTIFRREGSDASNIWAWDTTPTIPVLTDGTDITYNELNGGTWQQTAITTNNTYVNYWVFGIPSIETTYQMIIIQGQAAYASLALAQEETFDLSIAGLAGISPEIIPLYQLTFRHGVGFGGSSKSRIEAIQSLVGSSYRATNISSVNDHGSLAGLGDDDHPQYVYKTTPLELTANYTITDADYVNLMLLGRNAPANTTFALPTLADNLGKRFECFNLSDYTLTVSGETIGTDTAQVGTDFDTISADGHIFSPGQVVIIDTGAAAGETRRIDSTTTNTLTVDSAFSDVVSGQTFTVVDGIMGDAQKNLGYGEKLTFFGANLGEDEWLAW